MQPPTEKGFCYPMGALEPMFAVKIASPRNPHLFSIDHISRFVTEERSSAPKRMEIWVYIAFPYHLQGFENENSDPILLVRDCFYDIEGEQTQFCTSSYTVSLSNCSEMQGSGVFSIFQLHILENWGASFTCLYRFRVHQSVFVLNFGYCAIITKEPRK